MILNDKRWEHEVSILSFRHDLFAPDWVSN